MHRIVIVDTSFRREDAKAQRRERANLSLFLCFHLISLDKLATLSVARHTRVSFARRAGRRQRGSCNYAVHGTSGASIDARARARDEY